MILLQGKHLSLSKAPQGNGIGATGSKTPPPHIRTLVFLCSVWFSEPWFGSKTPLPLYRCP